MVKKEFICTSCKKKIENLGDVAIFKCPSCLKIEVIRCRGCRVKGTKYICPACNFEGPN